LDSHEQAQIFAKIQNDRIFEMLTSPQILIVAGTSVTTGFIPAQRVEVTGGITASSASTPQPPQIRTINLLSPTLDSRVSYKGPAHTYVNQNGNLITSQENEWPLEYQNGVAVGRHEPEPASQNFMSDSAFSSVSETQEGQNTVWIMSQSAGVTVSPSDDGSFFALSLEKPGWTRTGVFSEGTNTFIAADQDSGISTDWTSAIRTFSNGSVARIRWYIARSDSNSYFYGRCPDLPIGNYVASVWREEGDTNQFARAAQVELGTIPTSPIFNDATSQNTRNASTVIVTNPGGATGITIRYTDSTTRTILFSGAQSINLPLASQAWSARYISEISYTT